MAENAQTRLERALIVAGPLPVVGLLMALAVVLVAIGHAFHSSHSELASTLGDLKPVHAGVAVGAEPVTWLRRVSLGERVLTDADGRARLRLDDGTSSVLDRKTELEMTQKGFRLKEGRAFVKTPNGAHPELQLLGVTVLPSGGSVGLELQGGKLSVFSADSELTLKGPDGKPVHVNAGETARFGDNQLKVAPERAFDDWTHGLAQPWAARGTPRRSIGELWGSSQLAGGSGSPLTIRSHNVNALVDRELARTTCRTVFFNAGSDNVSGDFRMALPPGALVSGFAVERQGSRQTAQIALAQRGAQELDSAGGVLEWAGDGWLRGTLPNVASGEELTIELSYSEWLAPRAHGEGQLVQYRYPLVGDGDAPLIGDFVARIDATPSAPTAVAAGYGATSDGGVVSVHRADFRPSADLVVDIQSHRAANRARLYVAPPSPLEPEAGSAVLLRAELPPAEARDGVSLAVVVDTSGSIEPALLDAERAVVEALISGMGARDRVAVVAADQGVRAVGPDKLGPVDDARRKAIRDGLGKLTLGGSTDLGRALETAADLLPADAPAGMVVYVGDGWVTLGDPSPDAIASRLSRRELGAPRLGAVAVGPLANRRVLAALTRGVGPLFEVLDTEDAARIAIELMADALRPALASVELDLGAEIDQVYPRAARAIPAGEVVTAVGRMRGDAPKLVTIRYRDARGTHEEQRALEVVRAEDPDDVRRRWAAERVDDIVLTGRGREAATDVALKAGLVTPWTALKVGGGGEYVSRALETRVLDLAADGASLVGPVLATASDLSGTLSSFEEESSGAESFAAALEPAARRVLDAAAPAVRACRDSRAALRPELAGSLEVSLSIDGDGLPHDVKVRGWQATADDAALNRCVQLVVEGLRFPRGATERVRIVHLLQLPPPPPSLGARHCSDVSHLPMPLRRGAWWARLTQGDAADVYVQAKRQCELPTWTDRRALLELMLNYASDGVIRVQLAARLALLGEADAATLLRREAVRRVKSPEELSNVRRELIGSELYPGSLFEQKYKAAANDEERLGVVTRFLELAPHDSRLRRRWVALLESLNRQDELRELSRQLEADPFADAPLLADTASALHHIGDDGNARRLFGDLSERAPGDPWIRGLLGDRLRREGWFDDASEAYLTLEHLVPGDARATLRSALAHASAGRLDIAERLLARVAQTGGRAGSAELGELSRQLGRILAQAALTSTERKPGTDEAEQLKRLRGELTLGETDTVLLIRAEAASPELKILLRDPATKISQDPDVASSSLGLYLFRVAGDQLSDKLFERISLTAPSELLPNHPIKLRVDALGPGADGPLLTRELTLPSDGKALALGQ